MDHKEFENLIDELEEDSLNTLKKKNSKYAPCDDALRNFHVGASIMGVTTGECLWGYATKHIVALRDKILRNDWEDKDDALEKIQDIQNYLTFIWCAINEDKTVEINKENTDFDYDFEENIYDCNKCKFGYIGDDDSHWNEAGHIIIDPCASCRNNICPNDPEYQTTPINFVKKES